MTDKNIKLTKEEKIQKATSFLKEVASLELSDEELKEISGGECKVHGYRCDQWRESMAPKEKEVFDKWHGKKK